jgi:hypothetical protein
MAPNSIGRASGGNQAEYASLFRPTPLVAGEIDDANAVERLGHGILLAIFPYAFCQ